MWQHVHGDTFRRIRKDNTLGEEMVFGRDDARRVTRLWHHSNYSNRLR